MFIETLDSGSSGNAYILGNANERLLIECGVPGKEMLKAVKFNTTSIAGCLVSHEHS